MFKFQKLMGCEGWDSLLSLIPMQLPAMLKIQSPRIKKFAKIWTFAICLTRNKNHAPFYSITLLTSRFYYHNEGDFNHLQINRKIDALCIEILVTCMKMTVSGIKWVKVKGRSDTKGMAIKTELACFPFLRSVLHLSSVTTGRVLTSQLASWSQDTLFSHLCLALLSLSFYSPSTLWAEYQDQVTSPFSTVWVRLLF